ncbi:hypothetical protein CONPUDRAFT_163813 [Coniophora puteana RWD-64-598 SS2]|uniref:Proteasome assembly chaperone 3 n=1 Tax=Coniophora puteana (strain RWD-64-598) TaxID=741705 RepID=A0A5M3MVK0_CONPW|nr:uncharacterized protein CONPUDRAFT_163813 [Coniophora puteana RWD-64-598 SS2]EIW82735.1 hypothetical protein CONPUDRAFT_163813 [Coniophora puteana RWD-64-598 SS2]
MPSITPADPTITTHTRFLPAPDPSLPGLAVHITALTGSYMIWAGTSSHTPQNSTQPRSATASMLQAGPGGALMEPDQDLDGDDGGADADAEARKKADERAAVERAMSGGLVARDWACAMPPAGARAESAATSLFRSSSSDVAFGMAQRFARRTQKQIFLSIDVPPAFMSAGSNSSSLLLRLERGIIDLLKEIEASS